MKHRVVLIGRITGLARPFFCSVRAPNLEIESTKKRNWCEQFLKQE